MKDVVVGVAAVLTPSCAGVHAPQLLPWIATYAPLSAADEHLFGSVELGSELGLVREEAESARIVPRRPPLV